MPRSLKDSRFIAVEGPIRVGKSTLAKLLADQLGTKHLAEPENNPFLDRFYRGEPGMAFAAQMWFLKERHEQLQKAGGNAGPVVSDYIFEKDKIFAYVNLSDAELALYNRYYQQLRQDVPLPDLVIYLQATPEVLKQRLKRKGIAEERAISDGYIEQLAAAYEHFFFHYTASDLLVVNTSEIDFVRNPAHLQRLLKRITGPVNGTQYFLPTEKHPIS
jgi:deoxyguanosine kinase